MATAATTAAANMAKHDVHHAPPVIADPPKELAREPLVLNNRSLGWITEAIAGICEKPMPKWW